MPIINKREVENMNTINADIVIEKGESYLALSFKDKSMVGRCKAKDWKKRD